jgi:hypothetical protein
MSIEASTEDSGDEGSSPGALKRFVSAGRGFWHNVSDADWNDWHWLLSTASPARQLTRPDAYADGEDSGTQLPITSWRSYHALFLHLINRG